MITVCIPTVRPGTISYAIASILRQRYDDWELLVVGQGDESALRAAVEAADEGDHRVRYIHLERMGLSLARNRGIEEARGEIVAFTDDDCEAPEDWLSAIHAGFERYPAVGVILGSLLRPKQRESRAFSVCPEVIAQELLYDPATGTSTPEGWGGAGGNFAFRREVLQAVGPFDELLGAGAPFPATEDTDYLIRVEALGWQMYSTPTVVIHHKYGYRYGLGAVYRLKRNYALGNGALAAKLALSGDPRGAPWLRAEIRNATIEPLRRLQWASMPMRLLRLAFFTRGYYACRTRCRIAQGPTGPGRAVLERASL